MKKFCAIIGLSASVLASSLAVNASDVSYNYAEGRFLLDAEVNDVDGDGFRFGGSLLLTPDLYVHGNYDMVEFDHDIDLDVLQAGAGYIYPLNQQWDANFEFSLVRTDVDNEDDTGFSFSGGIRGIVLPNIEARAKMTYIDVDDSDTFITVGADYFFSPNLSAGIEMDIAGDYETLSIGGRYHF